ncbi:hypothetical protein DACRYDRAFT_102582 [Dacryopinax primogenitus]|uniref:Membrane insertase YidC/Oxa/ALB C-terminal domain-containing protein n=1 Tax=Dacryopinax primogenitus (strain DJM 731) TaxID=1858805 RepID=M5FV81_DACPD|nr:uncharacterized protein DACRYDRAFT_102582 [Dacryopinax primogenitus]EJT97206.1 hypothetical protein DACRYDRAFT_102582 [Dacryopinax primogenitus]
MASPVLCRASVPLRGMMSVGGQRSLYLARPPPAFSLRTLPLVPPLISMRRQRPAVGIRAFSLWPFTSSPPAPLPPSNAAHSPESTSAAPTTPENIPNTPSPPDPVELSSAASTPPVDLPSHSTIPDLSETVPTIDPSSWPVMHFGDLASLDLGFSWTPASWAREGIELVSAGTGLPMWTSIILLTILVRFALFPLAVKSMRNSTALAKIQPEITRLQTQIKNSAKKGDYVKANLDQREIVALMSANKVKLGSTFVYPLAQITAGIGLFFGLRSMCLKPVPQMLEGGTAWFTNLCAEAHIFGQHAVWWAPWTWIGLDTLWILPMAATAVMYVNSRWGGDIGLQSQQVQNMRSFASNMVVLFAFITIVQPQAVCLYFLTNNAFLLLQSQLLANPTIRNYFAIPPPAPPSLDPPKPPFRWLEAPGKIRNWFEEQAKAAAEQERERVAQVVAREQRRTAQQPVKWFDLENERHAQAQSHKPKDAKHPPDRVAASNTLHEVEKQREKKMHAVPSKAGKVVITEESRQRRAKGKHMR